MSDSDPLTRWVSDIVLIGPVTSGKSTLAPLLAERLHVPHIALDRIAPAYYDESGFGEEDFARIVQEQGFLTAYRHWCPSLAYATERLLADHRHCVMDLGAGHSHYEDPVLFERVRCALAPYRNVVLLLPSPTLTRLSTSYGNEVGSSRGGTGSPTGTTLLRTGLRITAIMTWPP